MAPLLFDYANIAVEISIYTLSKKHIYVITLSHI